MLVAVGLVFGPSIAHRFVNLDDIECVRENPQVNHGLTAEGVAWAFTHSHANTWAPLTWLSHMLDCQIYHLSPWGHHLTNLLLHAATTVALFLVLSSMTGRVWPSALVAALFGLHPLQAESVAWVAERKGLLAGLCFTLTLAAYLRYVRRPFSLLRYLAVLAALALGLMAKPIVVTVPLVLLLLDYWPLGRNKGHGKGEREEQRGKREERRGEKKAGEAARRAGKRKTELPVAGAFDGAKSASPPLSALRSPLFLIVEKLPLLALVAAACWITVWAQGKALAPNDYLPLPWRIGNAAVSYGTYLGRFVSPAGLTVLYPHPALGFSPAKALYGLAPWKVAAGSLVLAVGTLTAIGLWRRCPSLIVGWLWFLVMMLPMIGLVQFGVQSMADRFTYLPQIGLWLALVWTLARAWPRRLRVRPIYAAIAAVVLATLAACAWRQASFCATPRPC